MISLQRLKGSTWVNGYNQRRSQVGSAGRAW